MPRKLEVSFNSPQCGWMSIGFNDGETEFHTTTAHSPHSKALSELLVTLINLLDKEVFSHTLRWNRNPEEFDFVFKRTKEKTRIKIIEYPTNERDVNKSEVVFSYAGDIRQIAEAFYKTFLQIYEERNIDEFEENWRQKFPTEEFKRLKARFQN